MGREVSVRQLNRRWSEIRIPKIGWIRFRDSRKRDGDICSVTVSRDADGWTVSIACKFRRSVPTAAVSDASVGIDRGVATALTLSNGDTYHLPASLEAVDKKHRRAQRAAARKTRGSNRHRRALRRAARLKARAARIRRHWQHETTTDIARRYSLVAVEALKTRNMTRSAKGTAAAPGKNVRAKSGLNRSILNVGWAEIARQLDYKLKERGGDLISVDPRYTSQCCADCGAIDPKSRKSQARFICTSCGHEAHADVNAAINILERALSTASEHGVDARVRGSIGCPDDPRTIAPHQLNGNENPRPSGRGRC
jgi:putative transposase